MLKGQCIVFPILLVNKYEFWGHIHAQAKWILRRIYGKVDEILAMNVRGPEKKKL
jgi:hypothetical protein